MDATGLRTLRKEMNLRQASLAKALGMTPQYIGLMERGLAPIEPRTEMSVRYLAEHPEARPEVMMEDVPTYTGAEIFERFLEEEGLHDGQQWGLWRLDLEYLTLDFDSRLVIVDHVDGEPIFARRERYYVPLTEMVNAKRVLDWIGQIALKPWGPVQLGHFIDALQEIFHLQGCFVQHSGFADETECATYLRERIKTAEAMQSVA